VAQAARSVQLRRRAQAARSGGELRRRAQSSSGGELRRRAQSSSGALRRRAQAARSGGALSPAQAGLKSYFAKELLSCRSLPLAAELAARWRSLAARWRSPLAGARRLKSFLHLVKLSLDPSV